MTHFMKTGPIATSMIIGAFALTACNGTSTDTGPITEAAKSVFSADGIPHAQLPSTVVPQEYRIDMRINPDDTGMSGVVSIDVDLTEPTNKIWLHAKEMTVTSASITMNGETAPLSFTAVPAADAPSGIAYLASETTMSKGDATIELSYETPFNLALNSAYKVTRGDDNYIVTQFEPLGAREAFPSFDEPKYKVPFTVSITAPSDDFVYANTPEIDATTMDDGWVKHSFAKTRPLPTYLVAFGVGPYDVVEYDALPTTAIRDRIIPLRGITARGKGGEIKYGLKNTAGILEAIEGYFGIPYPYEKLDIIAAPDYAFGAMENPGAIVYREYLMLMDENSALSQRRAYASVHSHEIAHQWFGNLVTPVWWEDIWLNEAFATWMGNKGINLWNPEGNFDRNTLRSSLGAMNIDTLSTTRKVREPLERSENVMDQFDGITYRKGGGVLDMFESYLGEEKFRDGVRLHMERYADDVATGDDFFQSIADGSKNPDVVDAMKSFVDQPGLPLVDAAMLCKGGKTDLTLSQSRYAPLGSSTQQGQSWQIPVCAKVGYASGTTEKQCWLMKDKTLKTSQSSTAKMPCPTFVMPNDNGAGYYRFALDTDGWAALLDNIDKLNTREVLAMKDSLESAFRAGKVEASVMIKGMETLAQSSEYDVASGAGSWLGWFYDRLPETSRPDVARLTQDMYAARYKRIAGTDTVEGNLLAPTLAGRLISMGGDDALKAEFAAKGHAYLAGDKKAAAQNMLSRSLRAAMDDKDTFATAEKLLDMAKDGSSFEKGAAIGALASTKNPDIAAMLRDTALVDDVALTGRQANSLVFSLLGSDEFGEGTWEWLKQNFKTFVGTRVPDVRKGGMPGAGGSFCSLDRRNEVETFFTENADVIPGYERSLAQTLESIELCAALKEAKADELVAALKAR